MQDTWLNASNAAHLLGKITKRSFTVANLNKICAAGHCATYICCDGAEGVEVGTSRKVRATDKQMLAKPKHMRRTVFKYLGEFTQEILTINQPIIVKGPVLVYSHEGKAAFSENSMTWNLTTGSSNYPVTFRRSDIEALAHKRDLIENLLTIGDDSSFKTFNTFEIEAEATNTSLIEDLQQQLEQERAARKAAEQRVMLAEAEAKPSHLLTIAGLLELLLDDSRPRYDQGTAATAIEAKGWRSASASTVTKLFAKANDAATDADKAAQAKAEAREAATKKTAKT